MSDTLESYIKGKGTSTSKMVVTHATSLDGTVYILKTEKWGEIRVINIRNNGSKCEFVASEYDLRAARVALNLFANANNWDTNEASPL